MEIDERILVGKWIREEGRLVADETSRQIEKLTTAVLRRVADRDDGWTVPYVDPGTGAYWELTYAESEMHGGGPPTLTRLAPPEAWARHPQLAAT
jgi:Immunity protein 27